MLLDLVKTFVRQAVIDWDVMPLDVINNARECARDTEDSWAIL